MRVAAGSRVVEVGGRTVVADDDRVDPAVVVEVADGQAAAQPGHLERRAGAGADVAQPAVRAAQHELRRHRVGNLGADIGDVAVDRQEVEPAVGVGVEEGDAEAQAEPAGGVQADRGRPVGEQAAAEVLVDTSSTRRRSW